MRAWLRYALMGAILVFFGAQQGLSQGTGSLTGIITDPTGAVVGGAAVTLKNVANGQVRTANTASDGGYVFAQLAPGAYKVEVVAKGFKTAVSKQVDAVVGSATTLDLQLELGAATETVQVNAGAAAVNTQDASIGTAFDARELVELPLEARNIVGLLGLQAGAVYLPGTDSRSGSIQGSRTDQSDYTLDGVSINDPQNQLSAFQTTLRMTPDSVQEFRTTTSNYGAQDGDHGGAQVQLVTKSGTNEFHGAAYDYLRNTATSTNEYFNRLAHLRTPKLNKNIFGASVGGPIQKNRLFIYGNYEGQLDSSESPALRRVPSDALRDGVIVYKCANAAACPGGTVLGLTQSHSVPAGSFGLTPAQFAAIDPLHIGPDPAVITQFQKFPQGNDPGFDGVNLIGFRFTAPQTTTLHTAILRLDYKIGSAGNHSLFFRGNLQDDTLNDIPEFPGQPPNSATRVLNKGMVVGYDAVFASHLVNSARWGFTRPHLNTEGLLSQPQVTFNALDDLPQRSPTSYDAEPTHELRDDLVWTRGAHTFQFGGDLSFARMHRFSNGNSFTSVSVNNNGLNGGGRAVVPGSSTCTVSPGCTAVPAAAVSAQGITAISAIDLLGVLASASANYNYTRAGTTLPVGAPVVREFGADRYAVYVQDQWRLRRSLTTTFGLRYNLYSPPWEVNGNQVCPTPGAGTYFNERRANMLKGLGDNVLPPLTFSLCGPANGKPGYYPWDKTNFSPRISVAWNPHFHSSFLRRLFGDGKTVFRGGYSVAYDDVGQALARTFDLGGTNLFSTAPSGGGSFGLSTSLSAPPGVVTESTVGARFTGINNLPGPPIVPAAPPGGFPAMPPLNALAFASTVDNTIVTPRVHMVNYTVERELPGNLTLQATYVGTFGRNLLSRRDIAQLADIVDPKSGMDFYTAAGILGKLARVGDPINYSVGTDTHLVQPLAYFENMFPGAAGHPLFDIFHVGAASTATQVMYDLFLGARGNYAGALLFADTSSTRHSILGLNAYSVSQFVGLPADGSIGISNYNAFELVLRKRTSHGLQFNLNYTYSHSLDTNSDTEKGNVTGGSQPLGGSSNFILDAWNPGKSYANSNFDVRHQVSANWIYELPVGRQRHFLNQAPGWLNQIVGGWQFAGVYRITSGFPFDVNSDGASTILIAPPNAVLVGPPPATGTTKDPSGFVSPFKNAAQARLAFAPGLPGEIGLRNFFRGDGYFDVDTSIRKVFPLLHDGRQRLAFAWDTFNLTNTSNFTPVRMNADPGVAGTFAHYNFTYPKCDGHAGRCMQFSLRFEF